MTIARSMLTGTKFQVEPVVEPSPESSPHMYNVMLHKVGGTWNEFYMGQVVTFLSVGDWCTMHGYKLVTLYAGTRLARRGEVTDLF